MALGYISRNTAAVLHATPDEVVARLAPDVVREVLGMRWVSASEDALFAFAARWVGLAHADDAAAASVFALVDLYRLSGPVLTTTAKPLVSAEPGRYVRLLESLLLRDSRPAPLPFRHHGFFAVGPARGAFPGYRRVAGAEFGCLVRGIAEQYAMEGGALPMLGLFDMADASVVVTDGVPHALDADATTTVTSSLPIRIKGVTLSVPSEHGASHNATRAVGWVRLSWANKTDLSLWPGVAAVSVAGPITTPAWTIEPTPVDKKGDYPAFYVLECVA
jgi:hypothetical protein